MRPALLAILFASACTSPAFAEDAKPKPTAAAVAPNPLVTLAATLSKATGQNVTPTDVPATVERLLAELQRQQDALRKLQAALAVECGR